MKITFIGFNLGPTRAFTNGPGMSFYNFLTAIQEDVEIDVFTVLPVEEKIGGINFFSINDTAQLAGSIGSSEVLHHWSGIDRRFVKIINAASLLGKKIVCGPNVLDTVQNEKEKSYLFGSDISLFLTTNDKLKHALSHQHAIPISKIKSFIVGPDLDLWSPAENRGSGGILWKGNCNHEVKDVDFGLRLRDALPQYKFMFLGHPAPYKYEEHISVAKTARVYINTSMSETKSQTLMESWASGVPSVTHPKIYLHGVNYKTGIITNKTIADYAEAICEIMEDKVLYSVLSDGALSYAREHLSKEVIRARYFSLLEGKL